MKNYVQPGNVVTLIAPANVKSGDGVLVGSLFGVAAYDALIGAEVEVALDRRVRPAGHRPDRRGRGRLLGRKPPARRRQRHHP